MARKANSSRQTQTVLAALLGATEDWHYGYDLSKATGLKSGTLYPILMRLEAQGWLEARWEEAPQPGKPARHLYRLTALGASEARSALRPAEGLQPAESLRPVREGGGP
ncbi:MAG TPA: PadR family transcriptional regulator [Dehalococcoidia bacterium]|jgi:DNA-binding PadR family transcriptional regulator